MSETRVFFFEDDKGEIPVHAWLLELAEKDPKAVAACIAKMKRIQTSTKRHSRSRKTRTTSDELEIIDKTIVGDNPELRQLVEEATVNTLVAGAIYDARQAAGLTQKGLAGLIGTKQPVISQLENADYQGHSLSMLKRIADALDQRLEIRFVAKDAQPEPMTT